MAVDNASQIDAIANDKENACLVLLITDHLNWDNEFEHLKILQDKMMLSRLVDTFFSRTSWTMLLYAENHSISVA